ncbi:PHB1 [Lepeophtheirus salmonis]|uniref:PHB1 n=1 Tax=Lepeophtheirus salmonis TaxID=72036 RepID=A0A7R8D5I7_LEPSM|nr:PHB1 [Lepeophtheirus salmonis]CAF3036138.1 PHB1 [Lepeophtheirus salmonis]
MQLLLRTLQSEDEGQRAFIFGHFGRIKETIVGEVTHFMIPSDLQKIPRYIMSTSRGFSKIYNAIGWTMMSNPSFYHQRSPQGSCCGRFQPHYKKKFVSTRINEELNIKASQFGILLDDMSITPLTLSREFTQAVVLKQDKEETIFRLEKVEQIKKRIHHYKIDHIFLYEEGMKSTSSPLPLPHQIPNLKGISNEDFLKKLSISTLLPSDQLCSRLRHEIFPTKGASEKELKSPSKYNLVGVNSPPSLIGQKEETDIGNVGKEDKGNFNRGIHPDAEFLGNSRTEKAEEEETYSEDWCKHIVRSFIESQEENSRYEGYSKELGLKHGTEEKSLNLNSTNTPDADDFSNDDSDWDWKED